MLEAIALFIAYQAVGITVYALIRSRLMWKK